MDQGLSQALGQSGGGDTGVKPIGNKSGQLGPRNVGLVHIPNFFPPTIQVEGLDPDNVRAMVRLAVGSRMVTVSEYYLQPISQQEFDKNSLDLSE